MSFYGGTAAPECVPGTTHAQEIDRGSLVAFDACSVVDASLLPMRILTPVRRLEDAGAEEVCLRL
jgi:hypothetical protein